MSFENLPTEVWLDLLYFLNRNECEKLQIVNRKLDQLVKNYSDLLPLRSLKEINAKNHTFKFSLMEEDRPIFDWSLDKETRINLETGMNLLEAKHEISLKNCIIEAFVMVCNHPLGEDQWNVEKIFEKLSFIRNLVGRPLLVKNFFFNSNDDTITHYVLAHLQELFENLLQVEIANLGFYSQIMQEIFNNPSLLEVSSLPMVVNVRCGYCWSEEVHPSFIKSVYRADLIMNLIQNIKLSDREYTFRLCYVEPGFQRKFKENFEQAELQRLPKKFSLKYYGGGGIVNIEVNDDDVKSINISYYRQGRSHRSGQGECPLRS